MNQSIQPSANPHQPNLQAVFSVYLLLAITLMFGSEVLVWTDPPGRSVVEWLLLIPGYLVLSAVVLDFTMRYRPRDLFGALVLAGIYSLAASLIINPASTLNEPPRTLVTRVMGAHALLGAEMLGLFLALTGGTRRRSFLIGCVIVGLAWGMWMRWWPQDNGLSEVSLVTMLMYGVIGLVLIGAAQFYAGHRANNLTLDELRLSPRGWSVVIVTVAILFIIRLAQGVIDGGTLVLVLLLLVLSWAILWFRGRTKGNTLLDAHIPVKPLGWGYLLIAVAVFLAVAIFAYNLPRIQLGEVYQLSIIALGFTAYGLAWLPTVSLVLGVQAYLRQISAGKL